MPTEYHEIPVNWEDIKNYVLCEDSDFVDAIIEADKVFLYDTCSFRFHSNMAATSMKGLIRFFKKEKSIIIITRCILMELASFSGTLHDSYVEYFKTLYDNDVTTFIIYEESLFNVMAQCFSGKNTIYGYLTWAVRMVRRPVSTVTNTLLGDKKLYEEIIGGKYRESSNAYRNFFYKVRYSKAHGDNLGEEILAICSHLLSHIPGTPDGKYCVITDDKGGAGIIATLFKKTNEQFAGARIIIYSTPRLVQAMYNLNVITDKPEIVGGLSCLGGSCITIAGMTEYDFGINYNISLSIEELISMIITPGKLSIVF